MESERREDERESLQLLLQLLKRRAQRPPMSASAAIGQATRQMQLLAAIYDLSLGKGGDGRVDLAAWCSTLAQAIARGLGDSMEIVSAATVRPRVPVRTAQLLGFALGELLADVHDRMGQAGLRPRAELSLDQNHEELVRVTVCDASPPGELPILAAELALALGGCLTENGAAGSCERHLSFDPEIPSLDPSRLRG